MIKSLELKVVDGKLETDEASFIKLLKKDIGALLQSYQPKPGDVINNIEYDPLSAEIMGSLDPIQLQAMFFTAYGFNYSEVAEKTGIGKRRLSGKLSIVYKELFYRSEEYDNRLNAALIYWHAYPQLFPREGIRQTSVQEINYSVIEKLSNARSDKTIGEELQSANENPVSSYTNRAMLELEKKLPLASHRKISAALYFKQGVLYVAKG